MSDGHKDPSDRAHFWERPAVPAVPVVPQPPAIESPAPAPVAPTPDPVVDTPAAAKPTRTRKAKKE